MDKIIELIKKKAAEDRCGDEEDFCTIDYGNYDDAYQVGVSDGEISFARELLKLVKELK